MAFPTITFNASTGSDTQASGAGPSTALHGLAGAHTNGSASTTIQLPASTDLSGVATDGSHCLWLNTAAGRQFSKITGKNDGADTVTVEDSFNIALASAVDWAIGGKRATLDDADSRTLFGSTGAKAGWSIQLETNQTLTSVLTWSAAGTNTSGGGLVRFLGGTDGTYYVINQTASAACISGPLFSCFVQGLKFTNSNGTKTNAFGWLFTSGTAGETIFHDCIFGDATNTLQSAFSMTQAPNVYFLNCAAVHCAAGGFTSSTSASAEFTFHHCVAHSNTGPGFSSSGNAPDRYVLVHCLAYDNTTDGILAGTSTIHAIHCTVDGNGGDGFDFNADNSPHVILGCQFTNNGGYGIRALAGADDVAYADFNNFFGNSLGARLTLTAGTSDVAVDPGYADEDEGDFSPSNPSVLGTGFPGNALPLGAGQSGSTQYLDIGAIQRSAGAGSGIVVRRGRIR